jgi:arylsulfatase A-like enzyme
MRCVRSAGRNRGGLHRVRAGRPGHWWVAGLVWLAACGPARYPNIVVIVIDTMRADRAGWSGGGREVTPFLDSLAQHGTVFSNVYAQSSWTSPSVASLVTSRYPSQHGVVSFTSVLADSERTLAELLHERGYVTGGFSANELLKREHGFGQGFDEYQVFESRRLLEKMPAERLNEKTLAWLDSLPKGEPARPVFLYLQYMEPHFPYSARKPAWDEMFERMVRRGFDRDHAFELLRALIWEKPNLFQHPDAETLTLIQALYDAAILSLDDSLGTLFAQLEVRGVLANAIVVVTADHGEEFLEHGHMGHGATLHEELIRVPLLVLLPGDDTARRVVDAVSLVDVAPTLLDLAGISSPSVFEGHSLTDRLGRQRFPARWFTAVRRLVFGAPPVAVAYSELVKPQGVLPAQAVPGQRALIAGSRKLILDGAPEFFDLQADPTEQHAAALTAAEQAALQRTIEDFGQRVAHNATRRESKTIDAQTKERMRALGYVE